MASDHVSDVEPPAIGIGTYDLTPGDCRRAVEHALKAGYRLVDTAEMYENERAVGDAIAAAEVPRDELFVATKIHSENLAYEDVLAHAQESRERLGVERIDLLYVHWPIREYDPGATLAAFDELYGRGVIDHVGLSNFTPGLLREAMTRSTPRCSPIRWSVTRSCRSRNSGGSRESTTTTSLPTRRWRKAP